jgi:hypothetical protein
MPRAFSSQPKRPDREKFSESQTTLVGSTAGSVRSSKPATIVEPTKPSLAGTIYENDRPITNVLLARLQTSESLQPAGLLSGSNKDNDKLTYVDLAHTIWAYGNPFLNMPKDFTDALEHRKGSINGSVAWKGDWGPGARTELESCIRLLSELAQKENVKAKASRDSFDWRVAACKIKRCADDLDTGVKLDGFTQEELHQDIVKQMETITGVKPTFPIDKPYSDVLDDWTMKTRGWEKATPRQNEIMDLSMLLFKENQERQQASQGTKGSQGSKDK